MGNNEAIIVAVISALGMVGTTILNSIVAYRSGKATRAATHADTIIDLTSQVQKFSQDLIELRGEINKIEQKNQTLWQYVVALLEQLKKHKITPQKPPAALESDPQLIKIFNKKSK